MQTILFLKAITMHQSCTSLILSSQKPYKVVPLLSPVYRCGFSGLPRACGDQGCLTPGLVCTQPPNPSPSLCRSIITTLGGQGPKRTTGKEELAERSAIKGTPEGQTFQTNRRRPGEKAKRQRPSCSQSSLAGRALSQAQASQQPLSNHLCSDSRPMGGSAASVVL